jgi:hypothetical protein
VTATARTPQNHSPRIRVALPIRNSVGLGQLLKRLTGRMGLTTCEGCERRAAALDRVFLFAAAHSNPCWRYTGPCTGFGKKQCVSGPEEYAPDAPLFEHCCSGWLQYPWIEVCPGQRPRTGCGFCLW